MSRRNILDPIVSRILSCPTALPAMVMTVGGNQKMARKNVTQKATIAHSCFIVIFHTNLKILKNLQKSPEF